MTHRAGGRCVNSSITGDTSTAGAQRSPGRLIHLSLRSLAARRSTDSAPSRPTPGSRRADPPRNHPSFMGCNPSTEWVTGGQRDSRGRRTMGLDVCFSFSLMHWHCCGAGLNAGCCLYERHSQVHHVCLCRWLQKYSSSSSLIAAE